MNCFTVSTNNYQNCFKTFAERHTEVKPLRKHNNADSVENTFLCVVIEQFSMALFLYRSSFRVAVILL